MTQCIKQEINSPPEFIGLSLKRTERKHVLMVYSQVQLLINPYAVFVHKCKLRGSIYWFYCAFITMQRWLCLVWPI